MQYNRNKTYFSFPLFRRFMKEHYNYECYLHDLAYVLGGSEVQRLLEDSKFSWRVMSKDKPLSVRVRASIIAVLAVPLLAMFGWWKWYRVEDVLREKLGHWR